MESSVVEAAQSCGLKVVNACWSGNRRIRWWTPVVKEAVKLKKEAVGSWLAQGSLEAADWYWTTRRAVARAVAEAKAMVWDEFGDTMVKDYRTASKKKARRDI